MNLYAIADEERIHAAAQVREWTRSGLLDASQGATIETGLHTDLKRTNRYLRVALFIFGTIVVVAAFGFWMVAFGVSRESVVGWSAIVAGVISCVLAQLLVVQFQLYRFGVEEAFAVWSVALLAVGAGLLTSSGGNSGDLPTLVACVTAAIASAYVFMRFGYLYAAFAAASAPRCPRSISACPGMRERIVCGVCPAGDFRRRADAAPDTRPELSRRRLRSD